MQFSLLKTAVAALVVCSDVVLGQLTGPVIVETLKTLTTQSDTLREDASGLTTISFIGSQSQKVLGDFKTIITTATQAVSGLQQTSGPIAEQDAVADAYKDFATVHKAAMEELIGKAGLVKQIFGGPFAAALRSDEGVIDTLSFAVIGLAPTRKAEMQKAEASLSLRIQDCEKAYSPSDVLDLGGGGGGLVKRGSAAFRESLRA